MKEWVRVAVQDEKGHEVAVWQIPYTGSQEGLERMIAALHATVISLGGVSE